MQRVAAAATGRSVTSASSTIHQDPQSSLSVAADTTPVTNSEVWSQHNNKPTEMLGCEYTDMPASISNEEGSLQRLRGSPYMRRKPVGGTSNQQTRSYEYLVPGLNRWHETDREPLSHINQKVNHFPYGTLRRDESETTVSAPDVNIPVSSGRYEQWNTIGLTGKGSSYGPRPPVVVHKPTTGGSRDGLSYVCHNEFWKNAFPGVAMKLVASAPDVSLKEPVRAPAWNTLQSLATIGNAPEKTASSPDVHRPTPVANGWITSSPRGYPPRMLGSAPDINLARVHTTGKILNESAAGSNQNVGYTEPGTAICRGHEKNLQLVQKQEFPLDVLHQKCGNSAPDVRIPTASPWVERSAKYDSHPSLCTHDDQSLYKKPECSLCFSYRAPVGEFKRHIANHHAVHHHHTLPRQQQVDEATHCLCNNLSWRSLATRCHYYQHNDVVTTNFGTNTHGHHSTTHYSHVTTVHGGTPSRMGDNYCYHGNCGTCRPHCNHEHDPHRSHYQHHRDRCHHEHKQKCLPHHHSHVDVRYARGCPNLHTHLPQEHQRSITQSSQQVCFCYERGAHSHLQRSRQMCCTSPDFQETSHANCHCCRHDARNRYVSRDGGLSNEVRSAMVDDCHNSGMRAVSAMPFDSGESCEVMGSPVPHISERGKCEQQDAAACLGMPPPGALRSADARAATLPAGRAEKLEATPPASTRTLSRGRRSGAGTTVFQFQQQQGAAHPGAARAMLTGSRDGWSALAPGEASDEGCCSLSPRVATPGAADAEEPPPAQSAPGGGWPWPQAQPGPVPGSVPERAARCLSCADSALGLDEETTAIDLSAPVEARAHPPLALQQIPNQTAARHHQQTALHDLEFDQKEARHHWNEDAEVPISPPPDDGRYDSGLGPEDVSPACYNRQHSLSSWPATVDSFKKPTVARLDSGVSIEEGQERDVLKVTRGVGLLRLRGLTEVSDGSGLQTKDWFGEEKTLVLSEDDKTAQDERVTIRANIHEHVTGDERRQWYSLSRVSEQNETEILGSTRRASEAPEIVDRDEIFRSVGSHGNGSDRGKNLEVCSKWCETGKVTSASTEDLCAEIRRNHASEWEVARDEKADLPSDRDWPESRKASSVTGEDDRECSWQGRQGDIVPATSWTDDFGTDTRSERWSSWNTGEMDEEMERQPPEIGTLGGLFLPGRPGMKFDPERDTVLHHGDHEDLAGESEDCVVELRRQSTQSFDDGEEGPPGQARYWRTPSVVVSDYSDDVPYCGPPGEGGGDAGADDGDQLSECGSSCSGLSAADTDVDGGLLTPERKASDCSTCSTLSGDDDASVEALLQPVRTRPKVRRQPLCTFGTANHLRSWRVCVDKDGGGSTVVADPP
ncbi:uncharacterized protein LOC126424683 [Schistocerca serialis cubense]|uniref:uncharacterized protein LOC126424683 n=1 Tax=Schistocerca serialis cubense TaxID=2023355 RepID=UPI00214DF117|nr:uncharacterized protein LOC126424683 [Schistocerca serialis cubense]